MSMMRAPPRKRACRPPQERQQLLEYLLPSPPQPDKPSYLAEDPVERKRLLAIERVRASIREHVYDACDPKHWETWSDDDPYDPIIDYEQLKFRYKCFALVALPSLYDSDDEAEMEMVVRLPGMPMILWATLDGRRAQLVLQDAITQDWLARGGDPPPQPVPNTWIDVDSDE
ncbi:uncharacterized protein SCHCODRAFT_02514844 [Schizophyllum commune H4-8]|nr:uncharacterized protein SCHCODRAFT_02514844 [Schizophyllum commune H4-8]KAI5887783.1 hypothetical protein SCHCODRAFT_02514844 [Schizophyllum commune H4-8]